MKKRLTFLLLALSALQCRCQETEFDFFTPPEDQEAFLVMGSYQYLYMRPGSAFRTGGMHPGLGINLARLFSKKFYLGVCADLKGVKGFTRQRFGGTFITDFNSNFNSVFSTAEDSAKAYAVRDAINHGVNRYYFRGNYSGSIGIMFSPFPQRYGGVMLIAKRGYRAYPVFGTYGNKNIGNGTAENVTLDCGGSYSFEVVLKPGTFFKNRFVKAKKEEVAVFYFMTVSLYAEALNLRKCTFDKMALADMVKPEFIDKYSQRPEFGLKLGLTIY